jgi:hypothetical protein
MSETSPSALNLEQLSQLKDAAAHQISEILNGFSAHTGLHIYTVHVDTIYAIGCKPRYVVELQVRL